MFLERGEFYLYIQEGIEKMVHTYADSYTVMLPVCLNGCVPSIM